VPRASKAVSKTASRSRRHFRCRNVFLRIRAAAKARFVIPKVRPV
jgi:hypothetical protein